MQASRRNCPYASLALPAVLLLAAQTHAEKLTIAGTPSGATLEIDGAVVGTTEASTGARPGPIHPPPAAFAFQDPGATASDSGTVVIESDPSAADRYVDWKFAGQTPSTLRLAGGPHHIELKLRGRQTWERQLQITNGSEITLRPVLEILPVNPSDH
jgi:PEGA domain-containing protein